MKSILFVDDDELVSASFKRAFRNEPYEMYFAQNGKDAIKILHSTQVDLVVTDYLMPNLDGIGLCKVMQSLFPNVPKIMLSGHATLSVATEALNQGGIEALLSKPVSAVELLLHINKLLDREAKVKEKKLKNKQTKIKNALEKEYPGITKVNRDENGVIELEPKL